MKLNKLEYFIKTCELGSITKAAELLYVSQPTISTAIKDLEHEFGVNLFHRNKNKLMVTKEGDYLLKAASQIISDINNLELTMKDFGKTLNQIKIGVPPMIGIFLFADIFRKYNKRYPNTNIQVLESGSLEIREHVLDDEVDLAIGIIDDNLKKKFDYCKFYETELVYCINKDHKFANKNIINITDLKDEKIILLKSDSYQNPIIKSEFQKAGFDPNIILYSSQLLTIMKFLEYGDIGAFMFKEIAEMYDDLLAIPIANPITIEIGLIWKRDKVLYSDAQRFINFIKDMYISK